MAVVPLLLATPSALAANRQARERAARKACLAGDAAKGVEMLAELFVETKDPTYIFNQGRCFEQNRLYRDAAARFEEYLRSADTQLRAEDRAAAQKHIVDCQEKDARERADSPLQPTAPTVTTPTPAPAVAPEPTPPPPEHAPSVVAEPTRPPAAGERRWGLMTAGIITSAVGLGGIVTGVIFNVKANSTVNDMETKLGAYSDAKSNDQKNYKTVAWVGYGAGAALAVAGAVLMGVGATRLGSAPSTDIAFVPAVGLGQVGAVVTGGF